VGHPSQWISDDAISQLLKEKGGSGEFQRKREKRLEYLEMQPRLKELVVQDINKMIVRKALCLLESDYGIKVASSPEDFEKPGPKGRCEELQLQGEFK
jgi:hypothetical protein